MSRPVRARAACAGFSRIASAASDDSEAVRSPAPVPIAVIAPAADALDGHHRAIWRYLRALGASAAEADDLAQETLLVGCGKPLPADAMQARAFLRGVARMQWLRTRRWWQRRREREIADAVEALWITDADADDGDARIEALRHCLQSLAPKAQQALDLHYRDGLDWATAAHRLGLRPNGVKTLVQRAREALRLCIERRRS